MKLVIEIEFEHNIKDRIDGRDRVAPVTSNRMDKSKVHQHGVTNGFVLLESEGIGYMNVHRNKVMKLKV